MWFSLPSNKTFKRKVNIKHFKEIVYKAKQLLAIHSTNIYLLRLYVADSDLGTEDAPEKKQTRIPAFIGFIL